MTWGAGMTENVSLVPLVPVWLIAVLALIGVALVVFGVIRGARGTVPRAVVVASLAVALLNPQAVREEHQPQRDVAVIVVDGSDSQNVGQRQSQTAAALKSLTDAAGRFDDLEIDVVEVKEGAREPASASADGDRGTRLFTALTETAAGIPRKRFAGAILITDGQIHDVPEAPPVPGPVHVLLTGKPGESDRRLVIEKAPSYGIVGKEVTIRYRVEDRVAENAVGFGSNLATVRLRHGNAEETVAQTPVGRSDRFTLTLDHAGPTIVELAVVPAPGELSVVNNRALVTINGVRDRLRVLLVSGHPHAGERTWRNLLKSDPSVDLVHFTILRPPEKDDFTPLKELALIAFPIQELFEIKLQEFDLIVFDRYVVRDVLPPSYLRNIVNYVKEGGALLLAVGPEFATPRSLFQTPLGPVMPASPTGHVVEHGFRPSLSDVGLRHPVTARLPRNAQTAPQWGRWFRHIDAVARSGHTVMHGADGKPLLLLERVGKGRIAQFLSDHIWLWARGFEGGGPQAELLRRLAHWLMKEPDLEEEGLKASVRDGRLRIERRSVKGDLPAITVTLPSGETRTLTLKEGPHGTSVADTEAGETGLYRADDGVHSALAIRGVLNPLEFADLRATADKVGAVVEASGGAVHWAADGIPQLRRTRPGRDSAGSGWLGLLANRSYVVSGLAQVPLLPGYVLLVLVLGGVMAAWYREGR